eukprot:5733932-Pleurochrysis_carterae.AAC.1
MNYHIAQAIASLRRDPTFQQPTEDTNAAQTSAIPTRGRTSRPAEAAASMPIAHPGDAPATTPSPDDSTAEANEQPHVRFQRTLGPYPLRSSTPSALLLTRRHRRYDTASDGVRGHGCALAVSSLSVDPRT